MSDHLLSYLAGAVAGVASCLVLLRFNLLPGLRLAAPATADTSTQGTAEPAAADVTSPAAAANGGTIAATLAPLAKQLSSLADDASHPGELADLPEFQAAAEILRRPDATTALLGQYAMGDNWSLACVALAVLAERPDRQTLAGKVMAQIPSMQTYALLYALRFLAALEQRPPAGAAVAGVPSWWQNNTIVLDSYREYFARCAALGDQPVFGDALDTQKDLDADDVSGLLQKVQHPFATDLLAALRSWQDKRVDRTFLKGVGTIEDPAAEDPLLVLPAAWRGLLATAEATIRQPHPRSLLVTGDAQVGKTAFIALLGARLQKAGWTLFTAGSNELMADQSYFGQLEGRIRKIVEALHARRKLVWFVRDLAQIATSGAHQSQSASILDQILPAIAAGELIIIGETSQNGAARLFQARPSLRALIEIVPLQPFDEAATASLATEVAGRIGALRSLQVPPATIAATLDLALHYLDSDQLPGVVLELLKRSADRALAAGETLLTAEGIVITLSQISGLPTLILDTHQRIDLAQIRDFFARRVMGQDEAAAAMVDRIAMLKAGLTDPGKPIGVFLFAGPTGTGKTELAKTLAEFLFGTADRMVRLDMSEFQMVESTSKILGRQGEHGGDSLADRIRKQPFSVVLLDEFEKAHANCWDLFLQIFDDGRLTDANGGVVDFRHCIIILTSNLGATAHRGSGLGFVPDQSPFGSEQVMRSISETFRPEFVNRLDKVIVFRPLSRELMRGILHKELAAVLGRRGLRERAWAVEWEASAIEFLLDRGFSAEMGARPLKRAIDQLLLAPLAATLVEHRFPQGDQFLFVRSNGREIEVEFVDPDAEPSQATAAPEPEPAGESAAHESLPAIVLRQTGSAAERAALAAHWREISATLASEAWRTRTDAPRLALADPAIWSRADRHRVFSQVELADRIAEAARTAERLFQRYAAAGVPIGHASRELAARLALQLYNLHQGIADLETGAPVDALLRVEPALDSAGGGDGAEAAAWCTQLTDMYRQWATKRRMQIREIAPAKGSEMPILQVTGFGAFRTLQAEAGLHVLEMDQRAESGRRITARVSAVGGAERAPPTSSAFADAARSLAALPASTSIIRRYREEPAPLVRDIVGGWRSGNLSAVLGGEFELIGATKRRLPTG